MTLEVPDFKKCFCCFPLRYGLLFWGYVKLIVSFVFLGMMIFLTIMLVNKIQRRVWEDFPIQWSIFYSLWEIALIVILTLVVLLEMSMNIVFIVGGHKKNAKLMNVFYYYNIVVLCLFIFAFSVSMTIQLLDGMPRLMRLGDVFEISTFYRRLNIGTGVLNAVVQFYFILLTRSEVRKLQNQASFRFENNAVEAKCNMEPENGILGQKSNENSEDMTEINFDDNKL